MPKKKVPRSAAADLLPQHRAPDAPPTAKPLARPLHADHHLVNGTEKCPGCGLGFRVGQMVTLVRIGPGGDREQRLRARTRQQYIPVALPAHQACVTGEEG